MKLNELKPVPGARHSKKRVGRGSSSGHMTPQVVEIKVKMLGGGGVRPGFEGGQTPLFKRLLKRGFTNVNRKEWAVVNLTDLNVFEDKSVVDIAALKQAGLVKVYDGVKILGDGN